MTVTNAISDRRCHDRGAVLHPRPDGGWYRYRLWRRWDPSQPIMVWVMLNPSTADADTDDQTLKKCMGFARKHGHGGVILVNLFAVMARDPRKLQTVLDPVGPENDEHILWACQSGGAIVAGWGAWRFARARATHVRELIGASGRAISCVGL